MNASELLGGEAPFVADTSAWWRTADLPDELGSLLEQAIVDDRLWITPIVRMEILYSARTSSEYVALAAELDALRILRNDRAVANEAASALGELAGRADGYHRVPPTDALIAAAAAERGGLAVLHREGHFDRLAEVLAFESVSFLARRAWLPHRPGEAEVQAASRRCFAVVPGGRLVGRTGTPACPRAAAATHPRDDRVPREDRAAGPCTLWSGSVRHGKEPDSGRGARRRKRPEAVLISTAARPTRTPRKANPGRDAAART